MAISYSSEQKLYKFEQTVQANGLNASISILMMTQITQIQIGGAAKQQPFIKDKKTEQNASEQNASAKNEIVKRNDEPKPNWSFKNLLPSPKAKYTPELETQPSQAQTAESKAPPKWFNSDDKITDVDMGKSPSQKQNYTQKQNSAKSSEKPNQSSDVWGSDSKHNSWA